MAEEWYERLTQEKEVLDQKIVKLVDFLLFGMSTAVSSTQRRLLRQQLYIMLDYSRVLSYRLGMEVEDENI